MKLKSEIFIQAPIAKVFSVFSDLSKIKDNLSGVQEIEVLEGPQQMVVGTKWKETRVLFGKESSEVMWVTSLEKNKSYVVEAESNGSHYWSEYQFEEMDGGTRVAFNFKGKALTFVAKLFSVLFIFFKGSVKKCMDDDMQDLKRVLEA